jgi:hypothetical protein
MEVGYIRNMRPSSDLVDQFIQTKDSITRIADEILELSITSANTIQVTLLLDDKYVPQAVVDVFKRILSGSNISLRTDSRSINDLSVEEYESCGTLFVYDVENFFTAPTFCEAFGAGKVLELRIFTHRIVSTPCEQQDQLPLLASTAARFGLVFAQFEYLTMRLTNCH